MMRLNLMLEDVTGCYMMLHEHQRKFADQGKDDDCSDCQIQDLSRLVLIYFVAAFIGW